MGYDINSILKIGNEELKNTVLTIAHKQVVEGMRVKDVRNTPYMILKNTSINDVERMVEDNDLPLFVVSKKSNFNIKEYDIDTLEDLEKLIWDEMLDDMEETKNYLLEFGLVLIPSLGQYTYNEDESITFEYTILVPMADSYKGYLVDVHEVSAINSVVDFERLAVDLCGLFGQETVLAKTPAFRKRADTMILDKNGNVKTWIGRRVERLPSGRFVDYASMLMEDAEAEIPSLDIRELYRKDLQDRLLDSDKWWRITSADDGGFVNIMNNLYTEEDRKLLNSLSMRNRIR